MGKHKRSPEAIQKRLTKRRLRSLILNSSFHDFERSETVCLVTRLEVLDLVSSGVPGS